MLKSEDPFLNCTEHRRAIASSYDLLVGGVPESEITSDLHLALYKRGFPVEQVPVVAWLAVRRAQDLREEDLLLIARNL